MFDEDDEPVFTVDNIMRWQNGELPREWLDHQMAILIARAKAQAKRFASLPDSYVAL